jgi:TPR repeat protein
VRDPRDNDIRVPVTRQEFDEWVTRAESGEVAAEFLLGYVYGTGTCRDLGIDPNLDNAKLWLGRAAAQGWVEALFWDGYARYIHSDWGQMASAFEYFEKAAAAGSSQAALFLGEQYEEGTLLTRDMEKAIAFYRQAASSGDALAEYRLGDALLFGEPKSSGAPEGLAWLEQAAQRGLVMAFLALARAKQKGRGCAIDPVAAYAWFRAAKDSHLMPAELPKWSIDLKKLERSLSPEDKGRALTMMAETLPRLREA